MLDRQTEIQLVDELFLAVPEFEVYVKDDGYAYPEKVPYILFDRLGAFVTELMLKGINIEITDACFNHINKLSDKNDIDIDTMLGVTFLESLASIVELRNATKLKLNNSALATFQKVLGSPMFNSSINRNL